MKTRRLLPILWPVTLTLVILLSFILASPALTFDPNPHGNSSTDPTCDSCHRVHSRTPFFLHPPTDTISEFCQNCHNDTNAPAVSTHSNIDSGGVEADFQLECTQCHTPHGNSTGNLYNIRESVRISPTLGTVGSVVFTATTGPNSYDDGSGSGICVVCHLNPDNPDYPMTNHAGGDHGSGMDYRNQDCATCHSHKSGFLHGGGSSTGCTFISDSSSVIFVGLCFVCLHLSLPVILLDKVFQILRPNKDETPPFPEANVRQQPFSHPAL